MIAVVDGAQMKMRMRKVMTTKTKARGETERNKGKDWRGSEGGGLKRGRR